MKKEETVQCFTCKEEKCQKNVVPMETVPNSLLRLIRKEHPDLSMEGYICLHDLNVFRKRYLEDLIEKEKGDLFDLEERALHSADEQAIAFKNVDAEFEEHLTFGERFSDRLAGFAGSWTFIIGFMSVLMVWIGINTFIILFHPFDPYPYILLNLFLSMIAAIQAPIILMSQNREEIRDRLRAKNDYIVNLKAEMEIQFLHEKIDHMLVKQNQRLIEIQQIQVELMEELARKAKPEAPSAPATGEA